MLSMEACISLHGCLNQMFMQEAQPVCLLFGADVSVELLKNQIITLCILGSVYPFEKYLIWTEESFALQ